MRGLLGKIILLITPLMISELVHTLSHIPPFGTLWTAARQAFLSITNSQSLLAHVRRVGDAIQPSHPLSSSSPPAFSLSLLILFSMLKSRSRGLPASQKLEKIYLGYCPVGAVRIADSTHESATYRHSRVLQFP